MDVGPALLCPVGGVDLIMQEVSQGQVVLQFSDETITEKTIITILTITNEEHYAYAICAFLLSQILKRRGTQQWK